jgi:hypothetical protein
MNGPHVYGDAVALPPEGAQTALGAALREV